MFIFVSLDIFKLKMHFMNDHFQHIILQSTGASSLFEMGTIQNLWSGYGKIRRFGLKGSSAKSVVVKHVRLPIPNGHPRGWNTDISHERKIKSYQVETAWYAKYSHKCDDLCRIPKCLAYESAGEEVLMVLEDLDAAGFPGRRTSVSLQEIKACLNWLANFHATFLQEKPNGLWQVGTYWHLETRPDELKVLDDNGLKRVAGKVDEKLNSSPFQTFVHGDAKLANFCFSKDGTKVAAVDFQYVGGGCGMKDVAYFIGSCLYEEDCEKMESQMLDFYFSALKNALKSKRSMVDVDALEKDWRILYPFAWTDFHRFIKGWSPGHWKINSYSERLAREVIHLIQS